MGFGVNLGFSGIWRVSEFGFWGAMVLVGFGVIGFEGVWNLDLSLGGFGWDSWFWVWGLGVYLGGLRLVWL